MLSETSTYSDNTGSSETPIDQAKKLKSSVGTILAAVSSVKSHPVGGQEQGNPGAFAMQFLSAKMQCTNFEGRQLAQLKIVDLVLLSHLFHCL